MGESAEVAPLFPESVRLNAVRRALGVGGRRRAGRGARLAAATEPWTLDAASPHLLARPLTGERRRAELAHVLPMSRGHRTATPPIRKRTDRRRFDRAVKAAPRPAPAPIDASPPRPRTWRDYAIPAALFAVALLLYLVRLDSASTYSYDEVYHAYTAARYVEGNADAYVWYTTVPTPKPNPNVAYEWTHPPLGKLIIAGGILAFGDKPFGWRVAASLFGALGIVVVYFFGLALARRRSVGVLAAGLLLCDGLYFVQSRTGIVDIFLTVFTTAMLLAFHSYLTAPADQVRTPLLLTGTLMGLSIATKWNGFYAAAFIGLVALWRLHRLRLAANGKRPKPEFVRAFRAQLVWIPVGLIALPAAIYLLSYLPFLLSGHGVSQLIELQRQMLYYHTHLKATQTYASKWWSWPLAWRPVWFYVQYAENTGAYIYANGNPLLYWGFLPAVLWVAWGWRRTRDAALTVLVIGFFGQWLPWIFSPRLAFIYHFLPAVPFGCLALAVVIDEWWRRGRILGRAVAGGYVAVIVAAFVFFYPVYSAVALTQRQFNLRIWFASWR